MPYQTALANALRARGLIVEEYAGWTTRGSSSLNPRGAVCHWTAGPCNATGRPSLSTVVNGRPGLNGPLCNVYLDRQGIAVVVAAGTANHAGSGGWKGLTGNSSVFGTEAECCNAGDWTPAQHQAYPLVNAAYCDLGRFGPDMVCGHNEWAAGRKIDIYDWDMNAMRQQTAAVLAGQAGGDDMTPEEHNMLAAAFENSAEARRMLAIVLGTTVPGTHAPTGRQEQDVYGELHGTFENSGEARRQGAVLLAVVEPTPPEKSIPEQLGDDNRR